MRLVGHYAGEGMRVGCGAVAVAVVGLIAAQLVLTGQQLIEVEKAIVRRAAHGSHVTGFCDLSWQMVR